MLVPIHYRDVHPDLYMISDNAEVFVKTENGKLIDITNRARKFKSNGYWHITLMDTFGKNKKYPLYRLVLGSFKGDQPDKVVDHLDMNKDHNYLSNLEYVTYDENLRRAAFAYNKRYRGLLSNETVHDICRLLEQGINIREIERRLNLPTEFTMDNTILRIIKRETYKSISKDYTWDNEDIRLKKYSKEDLAAIAYLVTHSGYGPKEIAESFPKYDLKQMNQVVKKMNQGKLYKKYLKEAGSTTILEGPRDEEGFIRMVPTELGVKRLRKIRRVS